MPSPRPSRIAWCLSSLMLVHQAACSSKPPQGADESDVQSDQDATSPAASDVDAQQVDEPGEVDSSADQDPPSDGDAGRPQQSGERDVDAASDSGSADDATVSVADSGAGDAGAGDAGASPIDTGAGPGASCQPIKVPAPSVIAPKVDFVWVVDSSQSMFDEQARLRSALHAFTQRVTQSSLDVRVIMVSRTPQLVPGNSIPGLCVELPADPLAGHPFASDPRYHFVETIVDSTAALNVAASAYARYGTFLRDRSAVHFVVVTDDDAQYAGGAAQFMAEMTSRLGRSFHLHTFSSPGPSACMASNCVGDPSQQGTVCATLAADCRASGVGKTCYELASLTNGVAASICDSDWTPGLDAILARALQAAPAACTYKIPAPPQGAFDPQKLNLWFVPQAPQAASILTKVDHTDACGDHESWIYSAAVGPSEVLLCPKACARAAAGADLQFAFGCHTIIQF